MDSTYVLGVALALLGGALIAIAYLFQKKSVKTVFWMDYGYIQFFNNKRPLTKPDDFKGLKMRTFSKGDADTLRALGAAPTVMSSSEMYMALQRGTVDGATTGMPAADRLPSATTVPPASRKRTIASSASSGT